MTRRYTHNVRGELVADTVRFGSTVLRAVRHERDALGRVTGTTESVGASSVSWRYHYDASGALDSVWRNGVLSSWWGYDSNGVRVLGSGVNGVTHDAADRVLSQNGVTFTYDRNGRLVSRRAGASETRYVYDLRGGLRAVDLPSGDRIAYGVDASGRRISRSVNGAVTHRWLWEGNLRPVGEVDSTGRVLARYVYGTRANVPDAIVRHDTLYRVITDERGSVRMVVNASTGEVASSLAYDVWGNVTESVHGEFQPFGFGGGLRDDATGLVRMGARDYAPELGRWTATDPIGFEGGDANLYGYVGNDPVNYVDPTGLAADLCTSPANSNDYLNSRGIPDDDDLYTIVSHGYDRGAAYWDTEKKKKVAWPVEKMAKQLSSQPEAGWKPGMPIKLYICEAGNWAPLLADLLDVPVIATTERVIIGVDAEGFHARPMQGGWTTYLPKELRPTKYQQGLTE